MKEKINIREVIDYWEQGAQNNFDTAKFLFKGRKYADCLFFCHLTLEKLLKAVVVRKTKTTAPYIHDLRRLAELADIPLKTEQGEILDEISIFNVAGRYPEEKLDFYKSYNQKPIAEKYLKITSDLILWLKKKSVKKR
ncbi:MAG: HEPN domain-containing protein [Candidatus Pacebacteria bacterium]|nr:HEPN domain-containing protein [Candidatus Paceibacterota bacterium]